jgi:cell growth-regulating nucleolar protein
MVSFSCEACGDVLTKKKLDGHRNQCRSAIFTCLDCQKTFHGTEYRAHTSCISEDQKYQGALYKEKPAKNSKRKSVAILEPSDQNALVPHQAYVEDEYDPPHPPHVPTPPSAVPNKRDSVFDYMVEEDQPNTPKIAYTKGREREEMSMKHNAPSVFTDSRASSRNGYRNNEERINSQDYQDNGFSYGTEPVNPRPYTNANTSFASLEFMTPAAKATKLKLESKDRPSHSRTNSGSEKKRKRGETNDSGTSVDTPMTDVVNQLVTVDNTPAIHSGLTGGLSKMMSEDNKAFPHLQSADLRDDHERRRERGRDDRRAREPYEEPASPLKRSRVSKDDPGLGISIKGRAVKALSMVGGALLPVPQHDASKTRRRASSSEHENQHSRTRDGEKRERKKHKVHRHNGTASSNIRHEHHRTRRRGSDSPDAQRRQLKAIEYRKGSESGSDSDDNRKNGDSQVVIFGAAEKQQRRCSSFLSNIPGTESEKGYSVHKALKRWHKQNDIKSNSSKSEEEQELWRGLRFRRNDRGEIVVTF